MRGNPAKTTEEQRLEILRVYKHGGVRAAESLCISLGLSRRYYSSLASARGVAVRKSRPLTPAEKEQMRAMRPRGDDHLDPRWQWAISRGSVIA